MNLLMTIFDMLASCMGSLILYRQLLKFLKGLIMKRYILSLPGIHPCRIMISGLRVNC